MRYITFLLLLSIGLSLEAQHPGNIAARTNLDTRFAPFYHGVASGDPLPNGVILWTRVTPDSPGPVTVNWQVALDTGMTNTVQSGNVTTDDNSDYTVKVDVSGLQPATWYYYQFEVNGRYSLVGRTYTAPMGDADSLRFALVSCSRYARGYFNVYGRLAQRNDVHAILHLGDYIYEDGDSSDRQHDPDHEIIDLDDYRMRHSQYKMDEDLRCLHQMYPVISVWDDHETANNSWKNGAENHQSNEGSWSDRKASGIQAYYEWMPIRQVDPNNQERIYRTVSYGDLMDLYMLDTRLIGRDEQVLGGGIDDPNRNLLGPDQLGWLSNEMGNTGAQWKVLGQQVMMAPLEIFGFPFNTDQWDGYRAERQRVYDSILTKNIEDVVVLTGDIHTFWANDLPGDNYDAGSGSGSVGVEFVVTSVTSANGGFPVGQGLIQLANPHMKYINLADHGYIIMDVNKTRLQGDFYIMDDIQTPQTYGDSEGPHWYVNHQERHLRESSSAATASPSVNALQPSKNPPNAAVSTQDPAGHIAFLGVYPNPTVQDFVLNYYLHKGGSVTLTLMDLTGKTLLQKEMGAQKPGLHYQQFEMSEVPAGAYLLQVRTPEGEATRRVIKH